MRHGCKCAFWNSITNTLVIPQHASLAHTVLTQAKSLGDQLVVGLIPDSEILRCKGPPVLNEDERFALVASVKWVDQVITGVRVCVCVCPRMCVFACAHVCVCVCVGGGLKWGEVGLFCGGSTCIYSCVREHICAMCVCVCLWWCEEVWMCGVDELICFKCVGMQARSCQ